MHNNIIMRLNNIIFQLQRNVTLVKDGDWIVIDKNRRSVPDDKQQETEQSVNSEYEVNLLFVINNMYLSILF